MCLVKQTREKSRQPSAQASDDMESVTSQSHESLLFEITRNKRRCSCSETARGTPCSRPETPNEKSVWQTQSDDTPISVPIPPPLTDHAGIHSELESVSTTQPSSEPLELAVDGDFRKQLVLSVPQDELGVEIRIQNVAVHHDNTEVGLLRSGAQGQDPKFSDVHWTWIGQFECRQAVSSPEVEPLGDSDHIAT